MRLRRIACPVLVLGLLGTAAHAAPEQKPKPGWCRPPVTDAVDDASPSMDVVAADVNTYGKELVAYLVLSSTDTSGYPLAVLGTRWTVRVDIKGVPYVFTLTRSVHGGETASVTVAGESYPAPVVRISATRVEWRIGRNALPPATPAKLPMTNFFASSSVFGQQVDYGRSSGIYQLGEPHCGKG